MYRAKITVTSVIVSNFTMSGSEFFGFSAYCSIIKGLKNTSIKTKHLLETISNISKLYFELTVSFQKKELTQIKYKK